MVVGSQRDDLTNQPVVQGSGRSMWLSPIPAKRLIQEHLKPSVVASLPRKQENARPLETQ